MFETNEELKVLYETMAQRLSNTVLFRRLESGKAASFGVQQAGPIMTILMLLGLFQQLSLKIDQKDERLRELEREVYRLKARNVQVSRSLSEPCVTAHLWPLSSKARTIFCWRERPKTTAM